MNETTISVNTTDWLRVTRDMRISVYVEGPAHAISQGELETYLKVRNWDITNGPIDF